MLIHLGEYSAAKAGMSPVDGGLKPTATSPTSTSAFTKAPGSTDSGAAAIVGGIIGSVLQAGALVGKGFIEADAQRKIAKEQAKAEAQKASIQQQMQQQLLQQQAAMMEALQKPSSSAQATPLDVTGIAKIAAIATVGVVGLVIGATLLKSLLRSDSPEQQAWPPPPWPGWPPQGPGHWPQGAPSHWRGP